MAEEYHNMDDVTNRLMRTRGAAAQLSEAVAKITVESLDALASEVRTVVQAGKNAYTTWDTASVLTGGKMGALYTKSRAIKGAAIAEFGESHPEVAAQFESVQLMDNSWTAIIKTARGILAAWTQVPNADTWECEDLLLADFQALIEEAEAMAQDVVNKQKASRKAASKVRAMATKVDKKVKAWYLAATAKYEDGTPDGVTVRSVLIGGEGSGGGGGGQPPLPTP